MRPPANALALTFALALVMFAVALGACDGDDEKTCVPEGSYVLPADCDVANCRAKACDTTCESGTTCGRVDCSGSPQCRIDCQPGATCGPTDCRDADVCFVACHGAGSTCEATCEGAQICSLTCYDGAECLLRCGATPASACHYDMCSGGSGMIDCGGGVIACNRACP
jgi:hypothetical protein